MLRDLLPFFRPAAEPPVTEHSFQMVSGVPFGQSAWRGYQQADTRRPSGEGSVDNAQFRTPDGVERTFQFLIAMGTGNGRIELTDLTPEAQFPDRITITRGADSQVWGNRTGYADRFGAQADYTRVSGSANVLLILATGETSTVTFHWD